LLRLDRPAREAANGRIHFPGRGLGDVVRRSARSGSSRDAEPTKTT
jgi:hypothetical protein